MQIAVAVLTGAAILSLGPRSSIGGQIIPVPLPFALFTHLPLLDNLLAVRLSFEIDACLAAVIAFGLDDLRRLRARRDEPDGVTRSRGWKLMAFATVVVVVTLFPQWPYPSTSAAGLPAQISDRIPSGNPVAITYPYASKTFPQPMQWQFEQNFSFRLIGGYATHPGSNGRLSIFANPLKPRELELFLEGQERYVPSGNNQPAPRLVINQTLVDNTRRALVDNNVRVIIVDRSILGSGEVMRLFSRAIGRPAAVSGHFALWASQAGPIR